MNLWKRIFKTLGSKCKNDHVLLKCRYVTAFYFIIANATTVGYGDIYGETPLEKTFLMFLQFAVICIFSLITGNITSLKWSTKLMDIMKEKVFILTILHIGIRNKSLHL